VITVRLSELIDDLETDSRLAPHGHSGTEWLISEWSGHPIEPSVLLSANEEDFHQYLEATSEDGHYIFPTVPPEQGAYQLLLVNIDDFLSKDRRPRQITIGPQKIDVIYEATLRDGEGDTLPAGDYGWTPYPNE
jgi:hypothetical protein